MNGPWMGIIDRYRKSLPSLKDSPPMRIITLHEGNTRLFPLRGIRKILNIKDNISVCVKIEGDNPTRSFKDRGMTLAVTKAVAEGVKAIICASTGNTAASAAAYAAAAGIKCIIVLPAGKVAAGKIIQVIAYGAKIVQVKGNFDDALKVVKHIAKNYPVKIVNSINPHRLEGQMTAAFEICEVAGAPDYHFIPVGNAGNITAYWRGYKIYSQHKKPKMMGFQAEGAAPIVENRIIDNPETLASAICIGNPASWKAALEARDESDGVIESVNDEKIIEAQDILAKKWGVHCEPASAASFAGLIKFIKEGRLEKKSTSKKSTSIVCTLTGDGLKDPDSPICSIDLDPAIDPDPKLVVKTLNL